MTLLLVIATAFMSPLISYVDTDWEVSAAYLRLLSAGAGGNTSAAGLCQLMSHAHGDALVRLPRRIAPVTGCSRMKLLV